jgi:uncharacterized membrane protein
MASKLYHFLDGIGYHHPLHPVLTHLPVGLTIAAFVFILLAYILKSDKYIHTARHCTVLAALAVIPTAIMGYMDWQHFYGGTYLMAIKMKIALAVILMGLLLIAASMGRIGARVSGKKLLVHFSGLLVVAGLGFFGGELVYGSKTVPAAAEPMVQGAVDTGARSAGEMLFNQKCAFCHFTDSTATKVGPGLKGLFKKEKMTFSDWPMTPENVRRQLQTPFRQMPPFDSLTEEQVQALLDYLQSL